MRPRMRPTRSPTVDGALTLECVRGLPTLRARVGVCHDGRSSPLTGKLLARDVDVLTLGFIEAAEGEAMTAR